MNLLRTSCFIFSINFWFMFFKCTLEFYTLSSKPGDLIIFYIHLHHHFAFMFTAAIKTDENHHELQTDQGNHIHQCNTLIFSLFQQEMQERNHQDWKLLDIVVWPGAKGCRSLGAWWHSVWWGDDFLSYLNKCYLMKLIASISVQLALKSRKYFYVSK